MNNAKRNTYPQREIKSAGSIEVKLPSAQDAKKWADLNRYHRRRSVAIMQGSQRDPKTGEITKRSLRKHTAEVMYRRGVEKYGVCPTRIGPEIA